MSEMRLLTSSTNMQINLQIHKWVTEIDLFLLACTAAWRAMAHEVRGKGVAALYLEAGDRKLEKLRFMSHQS